MRKLKRILLVDDDEVANFLSHKLLKRLDISEEVIVLFDGLEALTYVQQHCLSGEGHSPCVDLILLDLNMPLMDGFEFLEQFERLPIQQEVAVCILSSSSHERDIDRAAAFNVKGFISKPLTEEKVWAALQSLS
jgi:CheY-like chemotaxis protein